MGVITTPPSWRDDRRRDTTQPPAVPPPTAHRPERAVTERQPGGAVAHRRQERRDESIDVAVTFVASQAGGADRLLIIHRRLPSGNCSGCLSFTPWPCTTAGIALRVLDHERGQ